MAVHVERDATSHKHAGCLCSWPHCRSGRQKMDVRHWGSVLDSRNRCRVHRSTARCISCRQDDQWDFSRHLLDQRSDICLRDNTFASSRCCSLCIHILVGQYNFVATGNMADMRQNLGYMVAASIAFTRVTIIAPSGFLVCTTTDE